MKTKVAELMIENCIRVGCNDKMSRVILKLSDDREPMLAYVVDESGKLTGSITPRKLLKAVQFAAFRSTRDPSLEWGEVLSSVTIKYAADIMVTPISVTPEEKIEDVIIIMLDKNLYELPVVDKEDKLIGRINYCDIIVSWAKDARKVHIRSTAHEDQNLRNRLNFHR